MNIEQIKRAYSLIYGSRIATALEKRVLAGQVKHGDIEGAIKGLKTIEGRQNNEPDAEECRNARR